MMRFLCLSFLFTSLALADDRPNVLIIVADDLGYHDLGFQGSKDIPTPHLDKLAASSIRCTNGYVSHSFCSPTRAGMLTGRYQHRFGHENNPTWMPQSTAEGLPIQETTIADAMAGAGYTTGMVGKWHQGAHPQFHPNRRGFQEYFGALGGGHQYFPGDKGSVEYTIPMNRDGKDVPQTKYLTAEFGQEAAAYVQRHAAEDKPWLLYLAFNAPHTPLQAPEEWLAKVASIQDKNRRTYAAMIAAMDAEIGEVMAKLDSTGERDNTLIFFISDNGGPHLAFRGLGDFADNAPLRGAKGQMYEGGVRVPFLVSWPAKLKPGIYEEPVIALDFLPTALAAAGGGKGQPKDRPLDGVDLIPWLSGEKKGPPHEALFWRSGGPDGIHAMRRGSWKLVRLAGGQPELYDLSQDIAEAHDVAAQNPAVVAELTAAITEWEKGTISPVFSGAKGAQGKKNKGKGKEAPILPKL